MLESLMNIRRPVVVSLLGGLGNQLFQYAAARTLADRLNTDLYFDLSGYTPDQERTYELGVFKLRGEVMTEGLRGLIKKRIIFNRLANFQEASFAYDSRLQDLKCGVWVKGYFQSERYFLSNQSQIKRDLSLKSSLSPTTQRLENILKADKNSVSLHVRRGDYVSNPNFNAFHGLTSMEYYERGVDLVAQKIPNLKLYIFSDDPEWVSQNMKFKYPYTVMQANPPDRGFEDLYLMSLCRNHILANSSFSWWGAWLAKNDEQIVVAPKKWFQAAHMDDRDLVPPTWNRI